MKIYFAGSGMFTNRKNVHENTLMRHRLLSYYSVCISKIDEMQWEWFNDYSQSGTWNGSGDRPTIVKETSDFFLPPDQ